MNSSEGWLVLEMSLSIKGISSSLKTCYSQCDVRVESICLQLAFSNATDVHIYSSLGNKSFKGLVPYSNLFRKNDQRLHGRD